MTTITGRCLCGDIGYALDGPFLSMLHCHCSMCRKHHGSAFQTEVAAPASAFRWQQGVDGLASYTSSPGFERTFCPRCGSTMPPSEEGGDVIFVPAGNLEGDPQIAPRMHIFAGSKAPWHTITDGLPQHETCPPGYDAPRIDRPVPPATRQQIPVAAAVCAEPSAFGSAAVPGPCATATVPGAA